jgi:phage virion morphogenesis protein
VTVAVEAHIQGLSQLGAGLARMVALGERPRPIWDAIGQYGESSTRLRFKKQVDPDGVRWKPSIRAQQGGGQTLVMKARLLRSITHNADNNGTAWGTNVKYAAIHQFGGTIKAKGKNLRFQIGGRFVSVKAVTMPKRSFVGVNADDAREMLAVANDVIDLAARNRGAA